MPSWQPYWSDVVFDYGAAEAAASGLDRAAAQVRESYDSSSREDQRRSREWMGGHRRSFERDFGGCTESASGDIDAFRFDAARIRNAAAAARYEQWHREQSREQWRREAAAEEAARQEALRQEGLRQAAQRQVDDAAQAAAAAAAEAEIKGQLTTAR